jgi:hypothetical protein
VRRRYGAVGIAKTDAQNMILPKPIRILRERDFGLKYFDVQPFSAVVLFRIALHALFDPNQCWLVIAKRAQ